jgi:hypothetical protein
MQLADDDTLGTVDDERSVLRHQRNFAEEHFLLFDVADTLLSGLGIFIVDRQANGDFQRRGVGHAALFAFRNSVLQLQVHRVAAAITEGDDILVERSAAMAQYLAGMERVGADGGAAVGLRQVERRWCSPFRFPHLHSQLPIE